jgi:glucan 1,3-beta-glucosidase
MYNQGMDLIKGVNLGGWLVLEKWITPSIFTGSAAEDEYTLCQTGGKSIAERLAKHHSTFITEADFKWLAEQGITAVRIPVGYWIFGDVEPYYGAIEYLDKAFGWAEANRIDILLCLHGAPGSQNGEMHSGKKGAVGWDEDPANITQTVEVITRLAERYKLSSNLWGIELLNEPAASIPKRTLKRYYHRAYHSIRKTCGADVRVIINDIYQSKHWRWPLHWPFYKNVWFDTHQYQIFTDRERAMDASGHIAYTQNSVRKLLRALRFHHHLIVGEWSAALDPRSLAGRSQTKVTAAYGSYFDTQQAVYGQTDGWFYWTYKTEAKLATTLKRVSDATSPFDPWNFILAPGDKKP